MNHPALDAYLDELLDLTVDAVAPAPVAANAPVMGVIDEPAREAHHLGGVEEQPLPLHAGAEEGCVRAMARIPTNDIEPSAMAAGWEGVSGAQAPGSDNDRTEDFTPPQPSPASRGECDEASAIESVTMAIDAGLLAELDNDPLFAGQATLAEERPLPLLPGGDGQGERGAQAPGSDSDRAVDFTPPQPSPASRGGSDGASAIERAAMLIDPSLLAELDNDPLFAAPTATPGVAPAMPQIDPGLLAELESDPLFAAMLAPNEPSPPAVPGIDPGLLAELESDPLFASQSAAEEKPLALHAGGEEGCLRAMARIPTNDIGPSPMAAGWEGVRGAQAPGPEVSRAVDFTPPQPSPASRGGSTSPRNAMPQADARGLRPVEVSPPALTPSVTTTHRWLRVAVGEDSYAVELLRVQEVGRTVPIVAMRGAAPSVLGAMNLRGRIVPVFDLGLWLGTGRITPDERARIVVVERDNELIGALVTAVDDVVTLGPDRIEPPLMASPSRAIVGVARVVAKPTVLLDANALFG